VVRRRAEELEITHAETSATSPGGLLVVVGGSQLITHSIIGDQVLIGRSSACDLVLDHRALSRRHAIVRRFPELSVQDLGSTNGIRLAGDVVRGGSPVRLAPGESFQIGPFSFLVISARSGESSTSSGTDGLVVEDPTLEGVSALIREIARSHVNVLVLGETGVGKEVLATTLHTLSGRTGPLASINCAALSEALLESELFGHDKGAFTGAVGARPGLLEAARGGSVFLDELGELPLALQAKLLRAVESREIRRLGSTRSIAIDVRIIAATNRELTAEVNAGRFRRDLYFRLDGVTLRIPPLRERPHAIGPLALRFLERVAHQLGRPHVRATPEVVAALAGYDWPGNVRELKAVIERAVLLSRGSQLSTRHLAFSGLGDRARVPGTLRAAVAEDMTAGDQTGGDETADATGDDALGLLDPEQRRDRARVIAAIEACAGNQTRAAKRLGIARTTLVNKLALYRIPRPRG
jgi:two-component system, NtrC family, response regulator AtoC